MSVGCPIAFAHFLSPSSSGRMLVYPKRHSEPDAKARRYTSEEPMETPKANIAKFMPTATSRVTLSISLKLDIRLPFFKKLNR